MRINDRHLTINVYHKLYKLDKFAFVSKLNVILRFSIPFSLPD